MRTVKRQEIDPVTGRYIQSDPIGFDGGVNTYLYVGANPVVRVDESGKIGIGKILRKLLKYSAWIFKNSSKRAEDIIRKSKLLRDTKGRKKILEKRGGYDQALEDLDYIAPGNVKKIDTRFGEGLTGKLDDGRTVTVRPGSSDGRPTLEIIKSNGRGVEIRYNDSTFIEKVL